MSPFNRAAWEGTKPLVAPMPTPLELGAIAWERADPESGSDKRGGMVVARHVDPDTGAVETVTVINSTMRHGHFEMVRHDLAANTIDRDTVEPPNRQRLGTFISGCCQAIGLKRVPLVGHRRWLFDVAVMLDELCKDMTAADTAARDEAREAS